MEKTRKPGKKTVFAVCGVLLSAALVLCAFTFSTNNTDKSTTETIYRESQVTRGDITVGVTETATATLKTRIVKFDYTSDIETLHVKAGQSVKKGDVLVTLSLESLLEELDDAKTTYQTALVELDEAKLNQQKGELSAESTYKSSLSKSDAAGDTYEITIEKLELAVEKAKNSIEEIQTEIRTYTTLLRHIDSYETDYETYTSLKDTYEDMKAWVADLKKRISDYKKEQGIDFSENDAEYKRLMENLETAEVELAAAKLEYEDEAKSYNRKYDTDLTDEDEIKELRTEAYKKLTEAELTLKDAQYNLDTAKITAGQTRDESLTDGESAEITYEMTLAQLANAVASKTLKVESAQKSITELEEALVSNTLTAPCDGIVTSVSVSEGDEVPGGSTILTISDSAQVFVYVTIAQDDIANISLGQAASLTMDAFETENFDGVVDSITTTPARSASGTASYNVTIQAKGDVAKIFEGMTGSATLITRQQKDVLYVSNRCIYAKDGASYVKVKEPDGTLVETPVQTGFSDGRNVEVTDGLTEGQTVIIESQVAAGA